VSKAASEQYVLAIGRLWGIETVILRVFNAYGPGQPLPPSHAPVIPRFLKQVATGGSAVVYGQGNQTRDFVYIDDVVDALVRAGQADGVDRAILNVGSGVEVSIAALLDTVEQVSGREAHRLHNGSERVGVSRLVADVSQARAVLGFVPRVNLAQGLRAMLEQDPRFRSV